MSETLYIVNAWDTEHADGRLAGGDCIGIYRFDREQVGDRKDAAEKAIARAFQEGNLDGRGLPGRYFSMHVTDRDAMFGWSVELVVKADEFLGNPSVVLEPEIFDD